MYALNLRIGSNSSQSAESYGIDLKPLLNKSTDLLSAKLKKKKKYNPTVYNVRRPRLLLDGYYVCLQLKFNHSHCLQLRA